MSQAAKAQEPSMEEILASIRRIIADDDGSGKAAKAAAPAPKPVPAPAPPPPPQPVANTQDDVDAMLADLEPAQEPPAPVAVEPEPPPPPPPAPEPEPAAEVLMLTEDMAAQVEPAPQPAGFRTIEAGSDVVFSDAPGKADDDARRQLDQARRQFDESPSSEQLLSRATTAAVDNAFNSLANTILGNNARTLEDLVKDMLRPMLKSWLDDNLPGLVERIVRSEIERVSRGR